MKLYIKTTRDKYELPLVVADSPKELAQKLGMSRRSVASMCSREQSGFHRVEIEEGNDMTMMRRMVKRDIGCR